MHKLLFFSQGFLLLDKFFTDEEISPVRKDIEVLVEELAQALKRAGAIEGELLYQTVDSIVGKAFAGIILSGLQTLADRVYAETLCSLRKSRSTIHMVFSGGGKRSEENAAFLT